jgi:hypothetical protein
VRNANLARVRRLIPVLLVVLLAAGCGSSKHAATTTTTQAPPSPAGLLGAGGTVLYSGGGWAVVTRGSQAVAAHLVGGTWRPDRSGIVKVEVLGPAKKSTRLPQAAAQITGPAHLIEEGLWIDGKELLEKGGGLTPEKVTVYGAPDKNLKPGKHVLIAYGRTDTHGTAVLYRFTVV